MKYEVYLTNTYFYILKFFVRDSAFSWKKPMIFWAFYKALYQNGLLTIVAKQDI